MKTLAVLCLLTLALPARCAEPAPLPQSPFGVCGFRSRLGRDVPEVWSVTDELANYVEDAGIGWDRAEIDWRDVQRAPDAWDWSFTDRLTAVYKDRPIAALGVLEGTARWMDAPPATDAERAQYADFVFHTVDRYKDTIHAWEIWSEENVAAFWKSPDPASYAQLLKAAYAAAKRADPACTVVFGGTSGADIDFIQGAFNAGAWDTCDAVSIHPFDAKSAPSLSAALRSVRTAATRNGVQKPIWITAAGYATDTTRDSELHQADNLVELYAVALSENVRKVFWFTLGDGPGRWGLIAGKNNVPDWGYTSTRRTKPAYYGLKHLTQALSPKGKRPAFLGYLPGSGSAIRLAFLADGEATHPVAILWTPVGGHETITFPASAGLHALSSRDVTVPIVNGRLNISEVPVIVTGFKAGALKAASTANDPFISPPTKSL